LCLLVIGLAMKDSKSDYRWIKVFGLLVHAWSESSFKVIGDLCGGGFVDIDEDTEKKTHLHFLRICINKSIGSFSSKLELIDGEWSYEISDGHTK